MADCCSCSGRRAVGWARADSPPKYFQLKLISRPRNEKRYDGIWHLQLPKEEDDSNFPLVPCIIFAAGVSPFLGISECAVWVRARDSKNPSLSDFRLGEAAIAATELSDSEVD